MFLVPRDALQPSVVGDCDLERKKGMVEYLVNTVYLCSVGFFTYLHKHLNFERLTHLSFETLNPLEPSVFVIVQRRIQTNNSCCTPQGSEGKYTVYNVNIHKVELHNIIRSTYKTTALVTKATLIATRKQR